MSGNFEEKKKMMDGVCRLGRIKWGI